MSVRASSGGVLLRPTLFAAALVAGALLLWALRDLILPVVVSGLLAYICRPLLTGFERHRVPRGVAVAMLLSAFVLAIAGVLSGARAVMPSELGMIELRIRLLYALNERYRTLMELDASLTRGNQLYRWLHADLDPLVDRVGAALALSAEERARLIASRPLGATTPPGSEAVLDADRANVETLERRARASGTTPEAQSEDTSARAGAWPFGRSPILGETLAPWLLAPLVFLFLLRDQGEIKRGLLSLVPNALFEPALTVAGDLDEAVGDWLRGLFLECFLLGLTLMALLALAGIPWRWAVAIGLIGGASNIVPYLGVAVATAAALTYALVGPGVRPLLPIMGEGQYAVLWVIAAVALAELLKNAVYEPVVLGAAVRLHPLLVVLGVAGGAILFGFAGVLLAIPVMVVFKVFVSSTARQLKAYGLV